MKKIKKWQKKVILINNQKGAIKTVSISFDFDFDFLI